MYIRGNGDLEGVNDYSVDLWQEPVFVNLARWR